MEPARAAAALLPGEPGVYRFRDDRGRALYVGRAVDLRRRVLSYWGDLRDRRHLRRMVPRIARVEAIVCDSGHEAAWLERNLLEHRKPYWNRSRGGQEVPVYLRLDARALTIVHEHQASEGRGRLFGPYLGGAKVRLATSALDRALPLAYADPGGGGFSRDMARVLGIAPTDRAALVEAVTATLHRDQSTLDIVRAELTRRRDAAAAALAFELAARVQLELGALEWITAEQKVTMSTLDDVDVAGWADGVLVRLEIRSGRMRAWSQAPCAEPAAAGPLAATPPAWRPFAQRTADLAARLDGALTPRPAGQ
jgi:excinuclease ABC subunit C